MAGIKLIVANTDYGWFKMLRQRPDLPEVNFWAPSAKSNFRALQPGELFLFKLRAPHNVIVGGGVFAHANRLPCSIAWETFGEMNGATTLEELRARILPKRRDDPSNDSDFQIGCRILTQPFFFAESEWMPVPASWSPNIVGFKGYNTENAEGLALWEQVADRLQSTSILGPDERLGLPSTPQVIHRRNGQGTFRALVTDIYQRRCAVTQERTLPALDAAHIRPYSIVRVHEERNGLLLRRDIHSLFDRGYVTVTPAHRFEVSRRIKEEFENGRHYYDLHGQEINVPKEAGKKPDPDALRWHNENCYQG